MKNPTIRYFALLEKVEYSGKTPKYRITRETAQWRAMQANTGTDGFVSLYYKPNMSSKKPEAPEMNLEFVKNGMNFSGVKFITTGTNRDNCRYAYGKPCDRPMTKKGVNHFYDYAGDGYVFIFHYGEYGMHLPIAIELIVIECDTILQVILGDIAKHMQQGGYRDMLERLRSGAHPVTPQTKRRHVRQDKNVFTPDERHPGRNRQP